MGGFCREGRLVLKMEEIFSRFVYLRMECFSFVEL